MRLTVRLLLSTIVSISMLVALTFMGLMLNTVIEKHLLSEKKYQLARVADDLSRLAVRDHYPDTKNRAQMDAWAKEMGELGSYRISLIDEHGHLYGDSLVPGEELDETDNHGRRPEVTAALESGLGESVRFSGTMRKNYMYAAVRLDSPGSPSKVLRVGTAINSLKHTRHNLLKVYALLAIAGLGLALALVWLGSRSLAGSFKNIVDAAKDMAEGRLDERAAKGAPGELGEVGTAINQLAINLSSQLTQTKTGLNQLLAILEAMSDGLVVLDSNGVVIRANKRSEEMLGLSSKEQKTLTELRYPELAEDYQRVHAGQNAPPRLLHHIGPPEKFIEARFSLVPGEAGEAVAVLHDLTERQQLYQMRRDFVANISHELRTPLTAIMGVVEAMRGKIEDKPEMDIFIPLLGILERQTARLHDMARDVLELAKLEKKSEALELESFGAHELFTEVIAELKAGQDSKLESRFEIIIQQDMPQLLANKTIIAAAVNNLVDNALKYGAKDSLITLKAGFDKNMVWLTVENQGPPIAHEDRERIFERFYRGEKSRRQGPGGTGLGLAIVKHAALSHNGIAELQCPPQGGASFTIKWPAKA